MSKTYPHEPMNAIVQTISNPYGDVRMDCTDIGLTKREYFAAMAMQGYCGGEYTGQSGMPVESIAKWSVEMADALIKQLNEGGEQ